MRRAILGKSLILGSLIGVCLLLSHPATSQSRTFHGVQVSQKFDTNSELADLIKKSTTKRFRNSTVRLGQWVVVPGAKDHYSTYETTEISELKSKTYTIILLTNTTSDNPKLLSLGVLCAENKLRPVGYRAFSSSGNRVTRELVDAPWVAPTDNFWQGLVNKVCSLGS